MANAAFAELVGHWTLDNGPGQILDSSGNENHGTLTAGNPMDVPGVHGKALEFHGLGAAGGGGDYFTIPHSPSLDIRSEISIALWIRPGADDPEGKGTETAPMAKALSTASPSWSFQVRYGWGSTSPFMAFTFNTSPRAWAYLGQKLNREEWCHIACSHDGTTLRSYLNGVEAGSTPMGQITSSPTPVLIGSDGWGCDWIGSIDDVRMYNHGITTEELAEILKGGQVELARDPVPEDAATDVPAGKVLTWTAGKYAATHDVYFGTVFDDVNDAGRADDRGVLVSQNQAATEFAPQGALEYGQTYFWRVDEVNAAPDNTIVKGVTWRFTAEPYGYPIAGITATASSAQPGMGPENTIDGSGLNDLDQHSTELTKMWMATGTQPTWIQYEFDQVYKLHELWVWNSNQLIEKLIGFGARNVTVEYSTDGATWTAIEGAPEFAQAPGTPTYSANTVVAFGGVEARFVKLTVDTVWGVAPQTGLSEVRFFHVPVQAFGPQPADGATGVAIDADLTWRPGRLAESHEVYFGADESALALADTPAGGSYTPAALNFGTTYFWKVDEIGADGPYEGAVWSFTTLEFATFEDFEAYNDDDNRIYDTWIDGWVNNTGSQIGYEVSPFAEKKIVHGGRQSMPFIYDNESSPFYSEAEREFATAQNWTGNGADSLCLWVQDAPANLYVTVQDSTGKSATVTNPPAAVAGQWVQWTIPFSNLTGVNMSRVKKMMIGVGNKAAPAAGTAGTVFIDDVGVGKPAL
jgi:hypothetical protein